MLGAPLPQTDDLSTFLLIGLDRFVLHRAPGTRLWNHTVLREANGAIGETFTGDIQLFDEEGHLVAEAQGLHLKRATREALRRIVRKSPLEDWLYEVQWQAKPNQLAASELTSSVSIGPLTDRRSAATAVGRFERGTRPGRVCRLRKC